MRGEAFERFVTSTLMDLIRSGDLGINPAQARVVHKPAYWSRARNAAIVFDVAAELRRAGVDEPFFIWIWECKDYGSPVGVHEIEEFHAKLEQVGLHRTKGTVATTGAFQSGAVAVAEAYGIGLVRFVRGGEMHTLLEAAPDVPDLEIRRALTMPALESALPIFFGLTTTGSPCRSAPAFCRAELANVDEAVDR